MDKQIVKFLVSIVDAKLLKTVASKVLESIDIQQAYRKKKASKTALFLSQIGARVRPETSAL